MMRKLQLLFLLMVAMGVQAQEKGMKMELWPNGATVASSDKEDKAEMTVYLPDAKKATGRAVVCCPGGGYSHLAMDHEGHQWATFFNNQGIALAEVPYAPWQPDGSRLRCRTGYQDGAQECRRLAH